MPLSSILMTFTMPEQMSNGWMSVFWLLPLTLSIAVTYKATKVSRIETVPFIRECVLLFGSILVFMLVAALILFAVAWLITG